MNKRLLSLLLIFVFAFSLVSCSSTVNTNSTETISATEKVDDLNVLEFPKYNEYDCKIDANVKNVILMIGDGMGENTIKDAEIFKGDKLVMSSCPYTTHVTTKSLDGTTDSAASATAMSCGIKTHNKAIGVDKDGKEVETLCEFAIARGLKTGLVVTQIINHATPAGMVAHTDYRGLYNVIINQEIKAGVDVLLGGGSEYYSKKLQKKLDDKSYKYITKENELDEINLLDDNRLLGLFAYNAMSAGKTPSLAKMTDKALNLLNNDDGFFLMVEGSNIDVDLANVDMLGAMDEMKSFDQAVDVALKFASENEGTLVIITADHETGKVELPKNVSKDEITDKLITNEGEHTKRNVLLMANGAKADELTKEELIDNTDISKFIRKFLNETYGKKPENILNRQ